MMKRLVLHLGTEKSGTSTIQNTLGESSIDLSNQEIVVADWKPFNHSYDFTPIFMDNAKKTYLYKKMSPIEETEWSSLLESYKERWEQLFGSFESGTCIISAENLCQLSSKEIARVLDFAMPYFDSVSAIAYVRNPLDSIRSRWEQRVKQMEQPRSGEELLQDAKRSLAFNFIQRWTGALGDDSVLIRSFDHAIGSPGGLLQDFSQALDLPVQLARSAETQSSNTSLGMEGVAFLLAYNAKYPAYVNRQANPERGLANRKHILYESMRRVSTERLKFELEFNQEEALRLNEQIRILNSSLPEDQHFSEVVHSDVKTELPSTESLNIDYLVDLVNELALHLGNYLDSFNVTKESED